MISMHIVSFQKNSVFYNRYFKCIEQEFFRIERKKFSRYYVVNLEKCEIVFKLLASNCILPNFCCTYTGCPQKTRTGINNYEFAKI